jgi:hypothetical protein
MRLARLEEKRTVGDAYMEDVTTTPEKLTKRALLGVGGLEMLPSAHRQGFLPTHLAKATSPSPRTPGQVRQFQNSPLTLPPGAAALAPLVLHGQSVPAFGVGKGAGAPLSEKLELMVAMCNIACKGVVSLRDEQQDQHTGMNNMRAQCEILRSKSSALWKQKRDLMHQLHQLERGRHEHSQHHERSARHHHDHRTSTTPQERSAYHDHDNQNIAHHERNVHHDHHQHHQHHHHRDLENKASLRSA